jgi:hypothetical protein
VPSCASKAHDEAQLLPPATSAEAERGFLHAESEHTSSALMSESMATLSLNVSPASVLTSNPLSEDLGLPSALTTESLALSNKSSGPCNLSDVMHVNMLYDGGEITPQLPTGHIDTGVINVENHDACKLHFPLMNSRNRAHVKF